MSTLNNQIKYRFSIMMNSVERIISTESLSKGLIITGASGVGKSYNVIKRLEEAHSNLECNYYFLNGKCTPLELYKKLYEARYSGSVLLLDDVEVFDNMDKLNILKAVLDTSDKRVVSYASSTSSLKKENIPTQFEFNGKVIFLTNTNLVELAKGSTKLAPHAEALITRNVFVDLELFDRESIMAHIENVMTETNILSKYGISDTASDAILKFISDNQKKFRSLSLRLPIHIADIYKSNWFDWETECSELLFDKE